MDADANLARRLQREEYNRSPSPPKRPHDSSREDDGGCSPTKIQKLSELEQAVLSKLEQAVSADAGRKLADLDPSESDSSASAP